MGQFHFVPEEYLALIRAEVPDYDRVQDEVAAATEGVAARAVLELGVGTGETARRVLARHPGARLVGVDVVVPEDPADAVTPLDAGYDLPDTVPDQLRWLADAGFDARATWARRDVAVIRADYPVA